MHTLRFYGRLFVSMAGFGLIVSASVFAWYENTGIAGLISFLIAGLCLTVVGILLLFRKPAEVAVEPKRVASGGSGRSGRDVCEQTGSGTLARMAGVPGPGVLAVVMMFRAVQLASSTFIERAVLVTVVTRCLYHSLDPRLAILLHFRLRIMVKTIPCRPYCPAFNIQDDKQEMRVSLFKDADQFVVFETHKRELQSM